MSMPRIAYAVPGLLAGLLLPAVGALPKAAPAGAVGMGDTTFTQTVAYVRRGQRLTLVNNSDLVHVVGPGQGGRVVDPPPGEPVAGFNLLQTNQAFTTGRWDRPGSYRLTCSVHPRMTLDVVVTG